MICPHCSFDNPEGRKFCRSCAKPLTAGASPQAAIAPPTAAAPPLPPQPQLNVMAVASFVLGVFGIFPPLGIASIVMGHVSRREIMKSQGRQHGMGIAFAGLILSYLQLGVFVLLCIVIAAGWQQFNHELDRNRWARAAIVQQIQHSPSELTTDAAGAKHQEEVVSALKLIRDKQNAWILVHRDRGYACNFNDLGIYSGNSTELGMHIRESHYQIDIRECRGVNEIKYLVMAVPRYNENPKDAPVFCLDQTDVIRKVDAAASIGCRTMGERVE